MHPIVFHTGGDNPQPNTEIPAENVNQIAPSCFTHPKLMITKYVYEHIRVVLCQGWQGMQFYNVYMMLKHC